MWLSLLKVITQNVTEVKILNSIQMIGLYSDDGRMFRLRHTV